MKGLDETFLFIPPMTLLEHFDFLKMKLGLAYLGPTDDTSLPLGGDRERV